MINNAKMRKLAYTGIIVVIILLFITGLTFGFYKLSFGDVIRTILNQTTEKMRFTVVTLRMPRLIMTFIMGLALATSGSVLQTLTKNDLADPGVIGINAGAGLGVTMAFLMLDFKADYIVYTLPLVGFIGAMITFGITMFASYEKHSGINMNKLILVGIGSAITLSGIMILFVSSAGREEVQFISKWLSGNIWGDKWPFVYVILPLVVLLVIYVRTKASTLDIMNLDEISAQSLGLNLKRERLFMMVASVALAAVVVSVAGSISFVGLIIPHMSKKLFGPSHKHFLFASGLLGGLFLMAADLIGRNILPPQGLLAGIVVSLIGAPYFLYLVVKSNR